MFVQKEVFILSFICLLGYISALKTSVSIHSCQKASLFRIKSSSLSPEETESDSLRLQRARLRLAEAQGIIPIGASENPNGISLKEYKSMPTQSKVREISWRVAEPAVKYEPDRAASKFFAQPLVWLKRNVEIFVPLIIFALSVIKDIIENKEQLNREKRADYLLDIISSQSPALIKAGQALASRPDLLPKEYLDSLQKLQDRCPAYPTEKAFALFESELGRPFEEVFELENLQPIAAASIGQVYKGKLRSNGATVAIKVQRPNCEESIAIDLFILRWYANLFQGLLRLVKRDIDLVSVIDDFGDLIYREIDYRAEAVNAQRFAELYASIPDVFVPKVYTALSTSKVLTMEWVDGARLNDRASIAAMGLDSSKFVDTLVQCSLRQMLENGFFHADPHAGNLLAMPSGKLCYLDFGMVSYVESAQRYSIIEAVVHLVNRDFVSLTELYRRMGFIPEDVDTKPIVIALEAALPDVLNAPVGELNFKNVIGKLGDVFYKFPFSLPPFYIAIIRCLGVLEGLAIQVDKDFRIISDAYPYIASRLLTDSSSQLQAALEQLLFKDGKPRWERLQSLLEESATTNDYDVTLAADQLLSYLVSQRGQPIRDILTIQLVEALDQLGADAADFAVTFSALSAASVTGKLPSILREGQKGGINAIADAIVKVATPAAQAAKPSPALVGAVKTVRILSQSDGFDNDKISLVLRKIIREPVAQAVIARVFTELSERTAARLVRRVIGGPEGTDTSIRSLKTQET